MAKARGGVDAQGKEAIDKLGNRSWRDKAVLLGFSQGAAVRAGAAPPLPLVLLVLPQLLRLLRRS